MRDYMKRELDQSIKNNLETQRQLTNWTGASTPQSREGGSSE